MSLKKFTSLAMVLFVSTTVARADVKPNILFISIDDLNDWVGCLGGHPNAKTPHIDALAQRGVLFTNATCPAPICNPSRTSVMTGYLPSTSKIYKNKPFFRSTPLLRDCKTLPQYFQLQGYHTMRSGKIFHNHLPTDRLSWDEAFPSLAVHKPKASAPQHLFESDTEGSYKWEVIPLDISDEEMDDGLVANWAIEQLQKKHEKPFFLAVGMYHPHLPWMVPRKYFEMHPIEEVELPPFKPKDRKDIPRIAWKFENNSGDRHFKKFSRTKVVWRKHVHAYLAACSFVDAQVGRVIKALDESPNKDNTLIVLWSDHGWHLGEKQHWTKFSLWEESGRVPLIMAGGTIPKGQRCDTPVSLVNLYPTLTKLCGLPDNEANEGLDMTPLLKDVNASWEVPSLCTHGANNHVLRTKKWRYTLWRDGSEELYDMENDPHCWTNLADLEEHRKVKKSLSKYFPKHTVIEAGH